MLCQPVMFFHLLVFHSDYQTICCALHRKSILDADAEVEVTTGVVVPSSSPHYYVVVVVVVEELFPHHHHLVVYVLYYADYHKIFFSLFPSS